MNDVVLLTGATGYLGRHVAQELTRRGLGTRTLGRREADVTVDLGDLEALSAAVAEAAPRYVLNCAAIADMVACQRQPHLASTVNGSAPAVMAEAAPGRFLQVSTDLVFAGDAAPYEHGDKAHPLSVYGMTKGAGERGAKGGHALVVRVPLLFGPSEGQERGATDMLLRAIRDRKAVTLFTDEHRTPLHVADAARGLVELLLDEDATGFRHLGGYERVSRFDLAMRLAKVKDLPIDWFEPALLDDPRRPRDVSLVGDWEPGKELDDVLAEC